MVNAKENGNERAAERREAHRHGADLEVRFRVVSHETGKKSREIPGGVRNLSETGFCLATDLTVVEDLHILTSSSGTSKNSLEVRILLPDEKEIRIEGVACWYNLSGPGSAYRYHVGVRIEKIADEAQTLFREFLRRERKNRFFKGFLGIKWLGRLFRTFS